MYIHTACHILFLPSQSLVTFQYIFLRTRTVKLPRVVFWRVIEGSRARGSVSFSIYSLFFWLRLHHKHKLDHCLFAQVLTNDGYCCKIFDYITWSSKKKIEVHVIAVVFCWQVLFNDKKEKLKKREILLYVGFFLMLNDIFSASKIFYCHTIVKVFSFSNYRHFR